MRISELELYVSYLQSKSHSLTSVEIRIQRQEYTTESEQEAFLDTLDTQEKEVSTFDEMKSVSKSLMKAIVKPTISHISDAYNGREVRIIFPKVTVFTHND